MSELIKLKQQPIIEFSEMEARGAEVAKKISQLNLDTIEATEPNRSMMKKMRSELNKELDVFEDQRKMIHGLITKPYKEFTESYDKNIKVLYVDATAKLKVKIDVVEHEMLSNKVDDIESYFNSKNQYVFLKLDNVSLKIILSVSIKKLKDQVDAFIASIDSDVDAINKMDNSVRIMSLYEETLNLSQSVSKVISDIKKEKDIEIEKKHREKLAKEAAEKKAKQDIIEAELKAKERAARKIRKAEELNKKQINAEKVAELNKSKEAEEEVKRLKMEKDQAEKDAIEAEKENKRLGAEKLERNKKEEAEKKIHTMSFNVSGTIAQLKQVKEFLIEIGMDYE